MGSADGRAAGERHRRTGGQAFAREDFEIGKFERENQVYLERNIAATRLQALVYPLMLFTSIGTIAIIWFGGQQVVAGTLTLGTLLAFSAYLARLAQPTRMLGFIIAWISRATPRRAPVRDPRRQVARRVPPRGAPAARHRGGSPSTVSLSATASCPARRRRAGGAPSGQRGGLVLQDVTLAAEPDQVVALLGHTGAGKTSLVALIPRFYDVTSGVAHRRAGRARGRSAEPAPADRDRDAGVAPLLRLGGGEHRLRRPRGVDGAHRAPLGRRRRSSSSPSCRRI